MLAWHAVCPCGWKAEANGPDEARRRCAEHSIVVAAERALPELHEKCYDPASCEYGPDYPCAKCALREAFHALGAAA